MNARTYEKVSGSKYLADTLFVKLNGGADPYQTAALYSEADGVLSVLVTDSVRAMVDKMMQSLGCVIMLVIACAAALAFVVIFDLGNINITERVREIATLKVLGFHRRETGAYVFRENVILSLICPIPGVPLGLILHRFVMDQIVIDIVSFRTYVRPLSIVISCALVVLFSLIVDRILRRQTARVSMSESLKSVE